MRPRIEVPDQEWWALLDVMRAARSVIFSGGSQPIAALEQTLADFDRVCEHKPLARLRPEEE